MQTAYDIIVIGAGSGGLSISLSAAKFGLKTLLIDKTDKHIGGDCLNYGCVPSKALVHIARIMSRAGEAENFGFKISGEPDFGKVTEYILSKQDVIRKHENAEYLRQQGMDVVLGEASFHSRNTVRVNDNLYHGKKIILATGLIPERLIVPGHEQVVQYDNESIFDLKHLLKKFLIVGGGPVGIELGQALRRLGCEVTIVHKNKHILPHDNPEVTGILLTKLQKEGIHFILEGEVEKFTGKNGAVIKTQNGERINETFDAVLAAVGRVSNLERLKLENGGIQVYGNTIVVNDYLQTTNRNVLVCGDIAGSLKFSHAAEQHSRLILNNLFSPFKKKLDNSKMSWVTFSDPQIATFGLSENHLNQKRIPFQKLSMELGDDRAVVDNYTYGKLIVYISKGGWLKPEKLLGGTMVAPDAGEVIQELILAHHQSLDINSFFNKIYPYPVAARANQLLVVRHKEKMLTDNVKKLLKALFRLFN